MAVDRDKIQEEASLLHLYKIILGWDYFQILKELNVVGAKSMIKKELLPIVLKSDNDEDAVIEWKHGVVTKCNESNGFHLPEFEEGKKLPTTFAFALVEYRQIRDTGGSGQNSDCRYLVVLRLRMHLTGQLMLMQTNKVESSPWLLNMRSLISEGGKSLYILKLCSLSTISREYVAVHSIGSLPFKDIILAAGEKNPTPSDLAWKISKPLGDYIKSDLNESQQQAINVGLSREPFVLIQVFLITKYL
ncbi:hypothetical protein BT93_F2979 [Corymbia citriodora subsp. variegata]|nr:hypothetical protein BT93_F2979 [Corymbia citriodora subsp. variegata]